MARPIEPQKLAMILETIKEFHTTHTISEISRMANVSPSSIRHHGLSQGFTFTQMWCRKKKVHVEGKYFNESHRENWLI